MTEPGKRTQPSKSGEFSNFQGQQLRPFRHPEAGGARRTLPRSCRDEIGQSLDQDFVTRLDAQAAEP
jgi:hypothetical protein